jgi:hypothetical protein
MLLISHRGNLTGPNLKMENSEAYILTALEKGFDVEVDVWKDAGNDIYFGHNAPTYKINLDFLVYHKNKLWIHCKNLLALDYMLTMDGFNYFWHQTDDYTLTSKGFMWTYPNKPVTEKNVIVIFGRVAKENLPNCFGICSDYVAEYC